MADTGRILLQLVDGARKPLEREILVRVIDGDKNQVLAESLKGPTIDIKVPMPPEQRTNVRFIEGDANALGTVLTPDVVARLEWPLLVIEDSTHTAETALAVLEFFAPILRSGEYIVVEDGVVSDLGRAHRFNGGPGAAISRFLFVHREFEIDAAFCDRYGHNLTGNPNGYLRKL